MLFVIVILTAVPALAQRTGTQDAAKVMDSFFNGFQNFSDCDSSARNAIHVAALARLQKQDLPAATIEDDVAKASAIVACHGTLVHKAIQVAHDLSSSIKDLKTESFDSMGPLSKSAVLPFEIVDNVETKVLPLVGDYENLEKLENFALNAEMDYEEQAESTRYRNLAARFNALVGHYNSGQRNGQRPASLHCEPTTTSSGVSTLDCQCLMPRRVCSRVRRPLINATVRNSPLTSMLGKFLLVLHRNEGVASGCGTLDAMHAGALPRANPPVRRGGNGQQRILIVLASRNPKTEGRV